MLNNFFGKKNRIESSVPLDAIAQIIEGTCGSVKRKGKQITFSNDLGETVVEAKPIRKQTMDGHEVSDIVTVRSGLPEQLSTIDEVKLSALNTMASMSALIKEQKDGKVLIVNRLTAYTGDIDSWRLYIPLIGLSASQGPTNHFAMSEKSNRSRALRAFGAFPKIVARSQLHLL